MGSATVQSLAQARERLRGLAEAHSLEFAQQLFAAADALAAVPQLRVLLTDPSVPDDERARASAAVFGSRIPLAAPFVGSLTQLRWSTDSEFAEAVAQLGFDALAADAQTRNELDGVLDELSGAVHVFATSGDLQLSLTQPGKRPDAERVLVDRLFGGLSLATRIVILRTVGSVRGSGIARELLRIEERMASFAGLRVAQVRSARSLSDEQEAELSASLETVAGSPVHLNVNVVPSLIGGVTVRIGDRLIDASAKTKLEQLRGVFAERAA